MNKQVQAIRAEIIRLYDVEAPKHGQQCDFDDGYFTGIAAISKFLDSLPDEQPNEDLEQAAITFATDTLPFGEGTYVDGGAYRGFIAGAEWQAKQMPMPEDTVLFQRGVEEGKRLMLEDAVDGECIDDTNAGVEIDTQYGVLFLPPHTFRYGDKVKIVIVKEDEK